MNKFPLIAAALLAGGCVSRPPPPPAAPPPVPAVAAPVPAPPAPEAPLPVYRNPKIGRVLLRAHQDAAGRLLGPQVMYQVVDPGGWNLEALDVPVPPEAPTAAGIVLTGRMRPEERAEAEAQAAQKGPGWMAVFDPQAGWLLLPPVEKSGAK